MFDSIVFICIGSNKVTGDCLGPLVGSYLKSMYKATVYGDMENPINYQNAEKIMKKVENNNGGSLKVVIDSALGKNIGDIIIDDGKVEIGKGLNKNKNIYGDISIKVVVGKNYHNNIKNIQELKNKNIEEIDKIAIDVVKMICNV